MSTKIRLADPDELAVVQKLNASAFDNDAEHDPYLVMTWPTDESGTNYFTSRITGEMGVCFVADSGVGIDGYLAGSMCPNESYRSGIRSELENMFVKEGARRNGVGSALVDAFVAWSLERGAEEVYVSAYFDNVRAVSFYESNGFRSYSHDLLLDLRKG